MKITSVTFAVLLLSISLNFAFAQSSTSTMGKKKADSLKLAYLDAAAIKYPELRQGYIAADFIGKANLETKLKGMPYWKGRSNISRVKMSFNMPLAMWGKNKVLSNVSYLREHISLTGQAGIAASGQPEQKRGFDETAVGIAVNYVRSDSLFNHPVYYAGGINMLTDELSAVRRVVYTGIITLPLRRTSLESLTVGAAVTSDASSLVPLIPFISYWKSLNRKNLELFIDLPTRIMLKQQLSEKSWLSFGSTLTNTTVFLDLKQPLPHHADFTAVELKTGPALEFLVSKKIIIGLGGGILSTISSRVYENGRRSGDYFIKGNNSSAPYVNFSVSLLPF